MDESNKDQLIKTIESEIEQTLPEGITINIVKNNLLILDLAKKYDKVTLTDGRVGEFIKLKKNYKFLVKINGITEEVYLYELDKLGGNLKKTFLQRLSSGKLIFLLGFILFLTAILAGMLIISTFTFLLIMAFTAIIIGIFMIPVAGREFKEEDDRINDIYNKLKDHTLEEVLTNPELSKLSNGLNHLYIYQLKEKVKR